MIYAACILLGVGAGVAGTYIGLVVYLSRGFR